MSDGTLQLVDPTATGAETNALAVSSAGPGAIVAVNPIPRFDGAAGGSDYAVSYQQGSNVVVGAGGLLRWDGTSSGLTAQPVRILCRRTGTRSANGIRASRKDGSRSATRPGNRSRWLCTRRPAPGTAAGTHRAG